MAEDTQNRSLIITNPFEIVGKRIYKVEIIERTETITERVLENSLDNLSTSGSASSKIRITFSDETQIEV